jgi:hypothetical protein
MNESIRFAEDAEINAIFDFSVGNTGQVNKLECSGDFLFFRIKSGDPLQPEVGNEASSLIGFLFSILISLDLDPGPCQQVEKSGFPSFGIAKEREVHEFSKARFHQSVKLGMVRIFIPMIFFRAWSMVASPFAQARS